MIIPQIWLPKSVHFQCVNKESLNSWWCSTNISTDRRFKKVVTLTWWSLISLSITVIMKSLAVAKFVAPILSELSTMKAKSTGAHLHSKSQTYKTGERHPQRSSQRKKWLLLQTYHNMLRNVRGNKKGKYKLVIIFGHAVKDTSSPQWPFLILIVRLGESWKVHRDFGEARSIGGWVGYKNWAFNLQQSFMMISRISHSCWEKWITDYGRVQWRHVTFKHKSQLLTAPGGEKKTGQLRFLSWEVLEQSWGLVLRKLDVSFWTEHTVSESKAQPEGGIRCAELPCLTRCLK